MIPRRIDRRTVLRGVGTCVALPLLDAMLPNVVRAADQQAPLRAAFLYVPNGKHMPDWTPQKTGRKFDLPATLQPLTAHRESLCVLSNLTLDGAAAHGDGPGDHARSAAAFLTGAHPRKSVDDIQNGISIDQAIAQSVGSETRFPSLELGLEGSSQAGSCDNGYSCAYPSNLAWRNATSPLAKEIDPTAIFDRLFASGESETDKKTSSLRKSRRKSVLDFALDDARKLHQQVGAADRRKLDEYLYAVREVEGRLVRSERLEVGKDGVPNYARPSGVPRELSEHCKLMLDMMALSFQTDSTRIATMMFANEGSNRSHPELDAPEGHHELSHHGKSAEKQAKIARINHFYVSQLAYFLDSLSSIREGERTLLDNCLVLYGSGISDGDRHNHDDLPILLAGQGGKRVKSGQHLMYEPKTPLCNLYLWMLHHFDAAADSFGDSNAVLEGLT
ncbi:MAG: DUF1552 domain-containing protein [Planctomycetales bacterium]|nr:DUF1552 domain-containing protein [Planctomycetales bacterium]